MRDHWNAPFPGFHRRESHNQATHRQLGRETAAQHLEATDRYTHNERPLSSPRGREGPNDALITQLETRKGYVMSESGRLVAFLPQATSPTPSPPSVLPLLPLLSNPSRPRPMLTPPPHIARSPLPRPLFSPFLSGNLQVGCQLVISLDISGGSGFLITQRGNVASPVLPRLLSSASRNAASALPPS